MGKQSDKTSQRRKRKLKRLIKRFVRGAILFLPILLLVLLVSFVNYLGHKKEAKKSQEAIAPIEITVKEPEPITASILTTGDIIMHDPFLNSNAYLSENGTYDYDSIFSYMQEYYTEADFTVMNLETTISDGNYSGYPRFRSPEAILAAIKQNGVDACMLANNHIYDNYDSGMKMTMDALKRQSLLYMGVRRTTSEPRYMIRDINGIKVGFFNYVFDTGAANGQDISINSIPVSDTSAPLINTFNYGNLEGLYTEIQSGLKEMENAGVEYTIAYIHWGNEYQTVESERQRKIAAQLCELGIDALIGGHPHVIQPIDLLTNAAGTHQMLCVYSLGNHLSDQYKERMDSMPTGHTEDGLMVKLVLEKSQNGTVALAEAEFIPTWVYRSSTTTENPEYYIMPLDNPSELLENARELELAVDIEESLQRTNAIIGDGVEKVQSALFLR